MIRGLAVIASAVMRLAIRATVLDRLAAIARGFDRPDFTDNIPAVVGADRVAGFKPRGAVLFLAHEYLTCHQLKARRRA